MPKSLWLTVAGGSIAVLLLLLFFGVNVAAVSSGDYKRALSPFAIKCWLFLLGYGVAFWCLSTLPKRSRRRRLASWLIAMAFNCFVLWFVYASGLGEAAFAVLLPETLVVGICVIGLAIAFRSGSGAA